MPHGAALAATTFMAAFSGADFSLVTNEWLDKNIRSKGTIGGRVSALGILDGRRYTFVLELD